MHNQADALADTIPVACARLGISRTVFYREVNELRLRAVKAGGRTLVTRADQQAWLNSLPAIHGQQASA
jgi:excisionase family DNA binding protein